MALKRGNWSFAEVERLRDLLPRRGLTDCARLLRRSEDSVAKKALVLLRAAPRKGAWTGEEDARLRLSWGCLPLRLLAPMLGRSSADVNRRANELRKQLRTGPWSAVELRGLKELYGTRTDADLVLSLARSESDLAQKANELCLAKDKRFAAQRHSVASHGPTARAMPRWSTTEVDRLREIYGDRDNLQVARALARTVTSVANKANQLGLKKSAALLTQIGHANVTLRHQAKVRLPATRCLAVGEVASST